MVLERRKG
jgi:hypothetical protein